MAAEHDDFRELRGDLREDIREMRTDMRDRFDRIEGRIDHVMGQISDHESRISIVEDRFLSGGESKTLMKNPRTYAVGGIGVAVGTVLLELMRTIGVSWGTK